MKRLAKFVGAALLFGLAATVNATPIGLNSASNLINNASATIDSSHLKMGGASVQIFNNATTAAFDPSLLGTRARPTIITQAMTMPVVNASGTATMGAQTIAGSAVQSTPSATTANDVLVVVSEPSILSLLVLGLFLAGIRRRP